MNRQRIGILAIVLTLASMFITSPAFSATSTAGVISPVSLVTQYGSVSGSIATLGIIEQSNSDNNPAAYVTFQSPSTPYVGYAVFRLPPDIRKDQISSTLLQVNFNGPSTQLWTWSILNWTTNRWIKLGDSTGTGAGVWNSLIFRVSSMANYISSGGVIRIQFKSNNANGDAKLDYEALHITYLPVTPTATRLTATAASTKPGYIFPSTYTPTITPTPTTTPTPTATSEPFPAISLSLFKTGFSRPVYISHAGDGSNRIFVVEQCGTVRIIDSGGNLLGTPFIDVSSLLTCAGNEQGLLSIVFPPNYASKNYFYAAYTIPDGSLRVSRFHVNPATPNQATTAGSNIIITISHTVNMNHNGGQLAFGNDGYLYVSTGDGGGAGDTPNNAQNKTVLLGKILRINVESGAAPYTIPASNPFVGVTGADEIWALGLRNPWRYSFDRLTHQLYIADVGQSAWEEVNVRPASSTGGENYGWHCYEGNHPYDTTGCQPQSSYIGPVVEYSHGSGCSITGGYVYRASQYPAMQGIYFYGDYCSGIIWGLRNIGGSWTSQLLLDTTYRISTFGEDESGNLYAADLNSGTIYKIGTAP
jgi:glucose/arabinose dehydrogenase